MPIKRDNLLLGEILVQKGLISNEQLETALRHQKKTGQFLGVALVNLGILKEKDVYPAIAKQLGVKYVLLEDLNIDPGLIEKVPAKFACHYKLIPILLEGNVLTVAVCDPMDIHILDDIKLLLNFDVKAVLAGENDILDAIKKYYGIGAETIEKMIDQAVPRDEIVSSAKTLDMQDMAEDASIIKFVNQIFLEAYSERATDIHIEPFEKDLKIRYRIDGVLYEAAIPPTIKYFQLPIVSRVKIMAGLNIAERRLPQDGRIKINIGKADLGLKGFILA